MSERETDSGQPFERSDYQWGTLTESTVHTNPILAIDRWIKEAQAAGSREPSAMCLATVGADATPSSRMVLVRAVTPEWITFFTNYQSRKGQETDANPIVCGTFWWPEVERQIRVEGRIERSPAEESDAYFASRPRASQLASACSPQSEIIPSRDEIEREIAAMDAAYPGAIPRPAHWGGYRIFPRRIEFWQGRPARLHDRLVYTFKTDGWQQNWLAP